MVSKTDYYELLGVTTSATPDELKLAYRKKALEWHPDKNPDRIDEAHDMFKAINEAYQVLSDTQERAWYDSHKDEILTGNKTEEMDLWPYFSEAAFPGGFTDEADGFFTVYRELFENIGLKENSEAKNKNEVQQRPKFGNSTSSIEEVKEFYNFWTHFSTIREFTWADAYNPAEAPNRNIRRLIDAENKKERNKEKRAFNEMVRDLVAYLKKRDSRWMNYQEELRNEKIRKANEEEQKKKEETAKKKEIMEQFRKEQAERYAREYEEKLKREMDENGEAAEYSSEEEVIYLCELCKKNFKTEKQLHNHENSKMHKQKLQQLQKEEEETKIPPEEIKNEEIPKKKNKKNKKEQKEEIVMPKEEVKEESEEETEDPHENEADHMHKLLKNRQAFAEEHEESSEDERGKKKKKNKVEETKDEVLIPERKVGKAKQKRNKKEAKNEPKVPEEAEEVEEKQEEEQKKGKAKLKREKKAQNQNSSEFKCRTCGSDCGSKNKLFSHLKETGHAIAK
ncbi:unnamed protein product [Blepharisma stoltei]|uniref:Uncharacterized protein n=1 Tax=Blepharisma stoltei TaxID=1481888 RepID=A0AAU9IXV4_9CILI|nr:unnamed protein product [Blepharisma stoltei]